MLRFPPRSILVPFDLSRFSVAAWQYARSLAQRHGASLEAAYVEEVLPLWDWPGPRRGLDAKLRREREDHLRDLIGRDADFGVFEGDPVVTLLRLARSRKPDLIVMGTHGRTGLDRAWLGSVAESMARRSPVPVLVTRVADKPVRSVLAPVNFTPYAEYGLAAAAAAAAGSGAKLTVLHCAGSAEGANPRFRLEGLLKRLPPEIARACSPEIRIVTGEAPAAILRAAGEHDLVILVAHRKASLGDILLGSTAERVLRQSPTPILALPAQRSAFRWHRWLPLNAQARPAGKR